MCRTRRLRALAMLSILGLVLQVDKAIAQTPLVPETTRQPAPSSAVPPGVQRALIRPDTPAERDAFLKRRMAAEQGTMKEAVPPLPVQAISPNASERKKGGTQ